MNKQEYEKQLFENVIASLERHGAKELLTSVIVTGSFGRGEPTYIQDADGNVTLKSDVEIALVYRGDGKRVTQLIEAVRGEFREDLNLMPLTEKRVKGAYNFNYSVRVPKYKTLFTYDLFNGSYTLWGEDFIGKAEIPQSMCDRYEAKRLVANRIGELTYQCAHGEDHAYLQKQWKGKIILAIAAAYLICEGAYVSSYHGQKDRIMDRADAVTDVLGESFLGEYEKTFRFLRDNGEEYETDDKILRELIKHINTYLKNHDLHKPRVNSLSRYTKYLIKYVKAGMGYGICGFEDCILQSLIDQYQNGDGAIQKTADIWHRVLY